MYPQFSIVCILQRGLALEPRILCSCVDNAANDECFFSRHLIHNSREVACVACCTFPEKRNQMRLEAAISPIYNSDRSTGPTCMSICDTGSLFRSSSSLSSRTSSLSNAMPLGPIISDKKANSSSLKPWFNFSSSVQSSSCYVQS